MEAAILQNFLDHYDETIMEEAAKTMEEPAAELPGWLFDQYEKNGGRLGYEEAYFARRRLLAVRGLAVILKIEKRTPVSAWEIRKLEEIIGCICREECWAVPAHVNRNGNRDWRKTADLFACETAQTLSEIADRAGSLLSGCIKSLIREQVEERVLKPFFSSEVPYAWWETSGSNWNAVCSGAIGSACLHLYKNKTMQLQRRLPRVIRAMEHYLAGFAFDGTCMEGIGYYTYGMTYFTNFSQELYEYAEGRTDLFSQSWGDFERIFDGASVEQCRKDKRYRIASFMEKCFFGDGKTVRFSDACEKDSYRVGLYSVLSLHYPALSRPDIRSAAGLHTDSCYRFAALKQDLLYGRKYLAILKRQKRLEEDSRQTQGKVRVLPQAQWCIVTSGSGAGFACKGGNNGEPHNHNDVGSFHYEADGELFLTDLGAGEYTGGYFGKNRYRILCNHSFGHSVPIVNGEGQGTGEEYRCTDFTEEDNTIHLEIAQAYPHGALKHLERTFHFDAESGALGIVDEADFSEAGETSSFHADRPDGWENVSEWKNCFVENLVTQISPVIKENCVILQGCRKLCRIEIPEISAKRIQVKECRHQNHEGKEEQVYAILWPVEPLNGKYRCTMRIVCL